MWLRNAFRRMSLPEPVTLKRLAAPLCVFIFGMSGLLWLCFLRLHGRLWFVPTACWGAALGGSTTARTTLLIGCQDHHHVPSVELGCRFDLGAGRQLFGDLVENPLPEFRVGHLSTPEHDRDLDLVALIQEVGHLAGLGVEVSTADLGPVLHLLDLHVG